MDKAKKRIRTCLVCAVIAAVFVGIVYYYYNVKEAGQMTDGTLIACVSSGWERLAHHGIR